MFKKAISLILLSVFLFQSTGCSSWRSEGPEVVSAERLGGGKHVILHLTNGDEVEMTNVVVSESEQVVRGELWALNGVYQRNQPPREVSIGEIEGISLLEFDGKKTFVRFVAIPALILAALSLLVALTKESCPFLYAEGEEGFDLRGELYSGAVFQQVERTDLLRLGHLPSREDRVRLRLANEAWETQYTDELTLLAVDHAKDIQVLPGPNGQIHSIRAPQQPLSASESRGGSVLEAVRSLDEKAWIPEPFQRDLDDPAHLRDQLTLSFPRPVGAQEATLLVRIRNTYWADHAFGSFLGLFGTQMNTWFASEGEKMTPGVWGTDFLAKQGMSLVVERGVNGDWEETGSFFPTGPIGWQEEVLTIPLDAQDSSGALDLRLTGGGMFWMVDYVAVDFSENLPVVIHELSPEKAVDQDGLDVANLLTSPDDQYHIMPRPGHYAEITYKVPPENPDMDRTYMVRSEGYYIIHQKNSGPPDYMKLAAIQANPEGFLRFSMEKFWEASAYTPPGTSRYPN